MNFSRLINEQKLFQSNIKSIKFLLNFIPLEKRIEGYFNIQFFTLL